MKIKISAFSSLSYIYPPSPSRQRFKQENTAALHHGSEFSLSLSLSLQHNHIPLEIPPHPIPFLSEDRSNQITISQPTTGIHFPLTLAKYLSEAPFQTRIDFNPTRRNHTFPIPGMECSSRPLTQKFTFHIIINQGEFGLMFVIACMRSSFFRSHYTI